MPSDVRDRSPSHHRSRSPKRHSVRVHSPADGHRYRSRSPKPRSPPAAEEARPKKKVTSGFKFKEKPRGDTSDEKDRNQSGKGVERGYRGRDSESRTHPPTQGDDRIAEKFGAGASVTDKFGEVNIAEKFGSPTEGGKPDEEGKKEKKKKKDKSKASMAQPALEMILVYVNDRLGTRAQIMCSPSDTIKDFKAFTAQKIGRKPHEIMVKRQGERPFKDQLTLEDYGVGNGVQLDLELDTGD